MKCSNKISCQGIDNNYHFKEFFPFFCYRFDFLAELDKLNEFENSLACDVRFVCATRKTLSYAPKKK